MTNCLNGQNNNSATPINALVSENFAVFLHHQEVATLPALAIAPNNLGVYYPEHLQTLLTQMFGRGAPGTKYSTATVDRWLEAEDAVVCLRIVDSQEIFTKKMAEEWLSRF